MGGSVWRWRLVRCSYPRDYRLEGFLMILDATTRSIEVVLAGAITTNQLNVVSEWVDMTSTTTTGDATTANTNNTTAVTVVAAPAASTQRRVLGMSIYNADTVSATVTVRYNDNATIYPIIKAALPAGYTLQYTDTAGWFTLDSTATKVGPAGPPGATGSSQLTLNSQTGTSYTLVLADVNATANVLVDRDNAAANTLTIPPHSSVAAPLLVPFYFRQKGAGATTLALGSGVTILPSISIVTRVSGSMIGAMQITTDVWAVWGDYV
jgi:hypothetical protein